MNIEPIHFAHIAGKFIDKYIDDIAGLDERLVSILKLELLSGNKISSVTTGWPQKESVVVSMAFALAKDHKRPKGIFFEMPNDPKSWHYQYSNYNYLNDIVTHMLVSGNKNA